MGKSLGRKTGTQMRCDKYRCGRLHRGSDANLEKRGLSDCTQNILRTGEHVRTWILHGHLYGTTIVEGAAVWINSQGHIQAALANEF